MEKAASEEDKLIKPYFEKLKQTPLSSRQHAFLGIIENNINDIKPFADQHSCLPAWVQIERGNHKPLGSPDGKAFPQPAREGID